ncbi:amidase domain-containing protein [Halalkalibacter krulwichiae]|uniref:Putative amidase domain protein n=1 Tax=Halalkalibacter krulwichiae TaxID=199441 RepID=A0A1X9M6Q1_9BACI|nr:amidase domain-containing protein [Halalkalibacter krulwichiae]ARK29097.1 Putative amidase domain protein [Halalkalibacter krulwichiae]
MKKNIVKQLHDLIEKRNRQYVEESRDEKDEVVERKIRMHRKRGAEIVKARVEGDILRSSRIGDELVVDYGLHSEFLIQLHDQLYIEELREGRRASFKNDELTLDQAHHHYEEEKQALKSPRQNIEHRSQALRAYNRRDAVRYAERWWDDYNPEYRKFTDNCTNFISQCLSAGGAQMAWHSDRAKGWWYSGDNWSLSWAVAHSFRWYLSGAKTGFRGEERQSALELVPGDIICYDFDGDGRWQHTTIVVAKDANGEPLVNAQTANSRMRYWKYEDSTAWTPNIKYKFFHIIN